MEKITDAGASLSKKSTLQNIAVFDLDGTLCKYNTLFASVRAQNKQAYYDQPMIKLLDCLFPIRRALYTRAYNELTSPALQLEFRDTALAILAQKRLEQNRLILMSCAPHGLVCQAAKALQMEYVCCKPGKKHKELYRFMPYKRLFVCTDNQSDHKLLDLADERIIYVTMRSYQFFKHRYKNATFLIK